MPDEKEVEASRSTLLVGNYVGDGIKGLLAEGGTSGRSTVQKLIESVGGKLEAFYYGFGDDDVYVIFDVPDNASAASLALTVTATGAVSGKTVVLMTPEEVDQATKKSPAYRPPGAR